MSYSSDEDEVPVVYLTEDYDDDVIAGPPLGHKPAAPVMKRRSRRKRPSDRERPDKLHRTSSGRRRKSETPMRLHKMDTPPPLSAQAHMHPQTKEPEIPHAFRLGGSLIDRAKAIFNPPPPAQPVPQTAPNTQAGGVRRNSPPPYNNGNQSNSYRHRANESWQSYRPEIRLNGASFASGRTTPGLAFDAFDLDNGITDPPPPLTGYGGEFKDAFLKEEMAELKNEEAKVAAEKKELEKEKKAPPPPKTYMQMLTELHPAVYFSLILGGLLIVRQRDDIEEYLQEGIGVFFNVVNAMVVIVTVIGAGLFIINFISRRRPTATAAADAAKAAPKAAEGEQKEGAGAKDGSPSRGKTLEDLMDNGYYDFGIPNYGVGPNSVLGGMRGGGGGGGYDNMLPGGIGLGVRGGLPGGGLGSAFAPYDDVGYSQNGSPPPLGFPRTQTVGGRSLSIPAILNPKPVRANQDAFYLGGMPTGRRSPTSVPVFDPNQGLKPGGSYFPYYDGGMGMGRHVRGLETPVIAPGGFPSMRMNNRPSPIINMGDKFQPMNMPSPAKIRDPKRSGFYDDDDTMSMASRMTPEVQFEKRGKDEPKGFTNPKKLLFTHREQTPVIKELEEDDASTIRLDNPNNHSYTDEFACKPYGPPPKRYNGINV